MELYLSACSKAAEAAAAAAAATAASGLGPDGQGRGDGKHRTQFPGVGAAQLLDMPLGAKLPLIPGSNTLFYTTNLGEKLFQPSSSFNLSDPYGLLLESKYRSLHDPHLSSYYKRKDMLQRLKKGGYITSNNKIVCTLREFNRYRQYLTSLKLDFERNYIREQKLLEKQVRQLQETSEVPEDTDAAQFRSWLVQEGAQCIQNQERLIRHRYLDMISRELENLERTTEEQCLQQLNEDEKRHREHTRRKLSLRRKIEEEWKTKEMLLLAKIGEEVKREARVEELRKKSREEKDRKKQALLERKMVYHLQKLQGHDSRREEKRRSTLESKGLDGLALETEDIEKQASSPKRKKTRKSQRRHHPEQKSAGLEKGPAAQATQASSTLVKDVSKKPAEHVVSQSDADTHGAPDPSKRNLEDAQVKPCSSVKEVNENSKIMPEPGISELTDRLLALSDHILALQSSSQPPPDNSSANGPPPAKRPFTKDRNFEGGEKKHSLQSETAQFHQPPTRSPSRHKAKPVPPAGPDATPPPGLADSDQNLLKSDSHGKGRADELSNIIENIMTWVVATVTGILFPAITMYEEKLRATLRSSSGDSSPSSQSFSGCSTCSAEPTHRHASPSPAAQPAGPESEAAPAARAVTPPSPRPPSGPSQTEASPRPEVATSPEELLGEEPSIEAEQSGAEAGGRPAVSPQAAPGSPPSKDAATETRESPVAGAGRASDPDEPAGKRAAPDVFIRFTGQLRDETEAILEGVFQKITRDLMEALPQLNVAAEFHLTERAPGAGREARPVPGGIISKADVRCVAGDIVENMLGKLQAAVEKKRSEILPVEEPPRGLGAFGLTASQEHFATHGPERAQRSSDPCPPGLACDIADDMVSIVLEKLTSFAHCKQNDLSGGKRPVEAPALEPPGPAVPPATAPSPPVRPQVAPATEDVARALSRSSVVRHVEDAIGAVLGYIKKELDDERMFVSEEGVGLLRLLDDLLGELDAGKSGEARTRQEDRNQPPRASTPVPHKGGYRVAASGAPPADPRAGRPSLPINVPGMVIYSEEETEAAEKMVASALDSCYGDWPPSGPRDGSGRAGPREDRLRVNSAFPDPPGSLGKELDALGDASGSPGRSRVDREAAVFSRDEKRPIQRAAENVVTAVLSETFHTVAGPGRDPPASTLGPEGRPARAPDPPIPAAEVRAVACEMVDAVLATLQAAALRLPTDSLPAPAGGALDVWFESGKKMKSLPPLGPDRGTSARPEPRPGEIGDRLDGLISKQLKTLVFSRLQAGPDPGSHSSGRRSRVPPGPGWAATARPPLKGASLREELEVYTAKVVRVVLGTIQTELEAKKEERRAGHPARRASPAPTAPLGISDRELDSMVSRLNDEIMASSLVTCVFELLAGSRDDADDALPGSMEGGERRTRPATPAAPRRSLPRECGARPCVLHSVFDDGGESRHPERLRARVLKGIGATLGEMLQRVGGEPERAPRDPRPFGAPGEACSLERLRAAPGLEARIQLVSNAILEDILRELCCTEMDGQERDAGRRRDPDGPLPSTLDEMVRCADVISSIVAAVAQEGGGEEGVSGKAVATPPLTGGTPPPLPPPTENGGLRDPGQRLRPAGGSSRRQGRRRAEPGRTEVREGHLCPDGGRGGERGRRGLLWSGGPGRPSAGRFRGPGPEGVGCHTEGHPGAAQRTLGAFRRRGRGTVPPREDRVSNLVDLMLDAVPPEIFKAPGLAESPGSASDPRTRRPGPARGSLPGGAEPEASPQASTPTEGGQGPGERPRDPPRPRHLEMTLRKMEAKLREPQSSPVVPIARRALREIFHMVLSSGSVSLSFARLRAAEEPAGRTSEVHLVRRTFGLPVSEADVTAVTDAFVQTVFRKLYSAVGTSRQVPDGGLPPVVPETGLPSLPARKEEAGSAASGSRGEVGLVEDMVQTALTQLGAFATSKARALVGPGAPAGPPAGPRRPPAPSHQRLPRLPTERFSFCSIQFGQEMATTSEGPFALPRLDTYASEAAGKILREIKRELREGAKGTSPVPPLLFAQSAEAGRIVDTVLDVLSARGRSDRLPPDGLTGSGQGARAGRKVFQKTEYRRELQVQIQDTVEAILEDIYEKTLREQWGSAHGTSGTSWPSVRRRDAVPKSAVASVASDSADLVLQNLRWAVEIGLAGPESASPTLPPLPCGPLCVQEEAGGDPRGERERGRGPGSGKRNGSECLETQEEAAPAGEGRSQRLPELGKGAAENITKTISSRLETFARENLGFLPRLASETTRRSLARLSEPGLGGLTPQVITVDEAEEVPATPRARSSFPAYAALIASAALKRIQRDLDREVRAAGPDRDDASLREKVTASEIVRASLKALSGTPTRDPGRRRSSRRAAPFDSQTTLRGEAPSAAMGGEDGDDGTLRSDYPGDPDGFLEESERQGGPLEELLRRWQRSGQGEMAQVSRAVEEVLIKVVRQVTEERDRGPPGILRDGSKLRPSAAPVRGGIPRLPVSWVAGDIVESVVGKMYSILTADLETEAASPSAGRGAGGGESPPGAPGSPPPPSSYEDGDASGADGPLAEAPSGSRGMAGEELVQIALHKITAWVALEAEGAIPGQSESGTGPRGPPGLAGEDLVPPPSPHFFSTGDGHPHRPASAGPSQAELKAYAREIVSDILETVVRGLHRLQEERGPSNTGTSPPDQITAASERARAVLRDLKAADSSDLPRGPTSPPARGLPSLERGPVGRPPRGPSPGGNAVEMLLGGWQAGARDPESGRRRIASAAESVLGELLLKTQELEHGVPLLNAPPAEAGESTWRDGLRRPPSASCQAQIESFGREMTTVLLEKLESCLSLPGLSPAGRDVAVRRKGQTARRSKQGRHLSSWKQSSSASPSRRKKARVLPGPETAQEMVTGVLHTLERFADAQLGRGSAYELSELMEMPPDGSRPPPPGKRRLPRLRPQSDPCDVARAGGPPGGDSIRKTLAPIHAFQSELRGHATEAVRRMLGVTKGLLDEEILRLEAAPPSDTRDHVRASEVILSLMGQCGSSPGKAVFRSSPGNAPLGGPAPGAGRTYVVYRAEMAAGTEAPGRRPRDGLLREDLGPVSVPGMVVYAEDGGKRQDGASPYLAPSLRYSAGEPVRALGPGPVPASGPRWFRRDGGASPARVRRTDSVERDLAFQGGSLWEGGIWAKLGGNERASPTVGARRTSPPGASGGKGADTEPLLPVGDPKDAAVSPLKICLAAENIVNAVLGGCGARDPPVSRGGQVEMLKPFFASPKTPPLSRSTSPAPGDPSRGHPLVTWGGERPGRPGEGRGVPQDRDQAAGEDALLSRWENNRPRKGKRSEPLRRPEAIAFAEQDLGPAEIHLVARRVVEAVVSCLKGLKFRGSYNRKAAGISILSRKLAVRRLESRPPPAGLGRAPGPPWGRETEASLELLCHHLTDAVVSHVVSRVSDGPARPRASPAPDRVVSVQSRGPGLRRLERLVVPVSALASGISDVTLRILSNSNILRAARTGGRPPAYGWYPGVSDADLDEVFQDLLVAAIHVLSQGLRAKAGPGGQGRPFPQPKGARFPDARPGAPRGVLDRPSPGDPIRPLADKIDRLLGSLRSNESKELVQTVFRIVFDLFPPGDDAGPAGASEGPADDVLGALPSRLGASRPESGLGLSPRSAFLLNVVCEKLIRTLLEQCTDLERDARGALLEDLSERLLPRIRRHGEDDPRRPKRTEDAGPAEPRRGGPRFAEEAEPGLEPSDSLLSVISHGLVKSLMEKLAASGSHPSPALEAPLPSPRPFGGRDEGTASGSPAGKPGPRPAKGALPPGSPAPGSVKTKGASPLGPPSPAGPDTRVYSATFVETVISDLFSQIFASFRDGAGCLPDAELDKLNVRFVEPVVEAFNRAPVSVLQDAEERLCFPPLCGEAVDRVVGSVFGEVLREYRARAADGRGAAGDLDALAERTTRLVLGEILDYQLPPCFVGKLPPGAYSPLRAEGVLRKLNASLRAAPAAYSTVLPYSFLEEVIRRLAARLFPPTAGDPDPSTRAVDEITQAVSKHKIWLAGHEAERDGRSEAALRRMVDSVYGHLLRLSGSRRAVRKSIAGQSPLVVDRIAGFIVQEIADHHLRPFLSAGMAPRFQAQVDPAPAPCVGRPGGGVYPAPFPEHALTGLSSEIVPLRGGGAGAQAVRDGDVVDHLVDSVYGDVLRQHGLDPGVARLPHPLFSGESAAPPAPIDAAVHAPGPYSTVLPYAFLEDLIVGLLARIFSSSPPRDGPGDPPRAGLNAVASRLIGDIRAKILRHEIGFSRDGEAAAAVHSEEEVQSLVDSVLGGIARESGPREAPQRDPAGGGTGDVPADRIAGAIVQSVCRRHLQPFVTARVPPRPSGETTPWLGLGARIYPSAFLEEITSGVVAKILGGQPGGPGSQLEERAAGLTRSVAEEFARARVSVLSQAAEETLGLPPVEKAVTARIVDSVHRRVLRGSCLARQGDPRTLAEEIAGVVLAETCHFQLQARLKGRVPPDSFSTLKAEAVTWRVRERLGPGGPPAGYTSTFSYAQVEEIVTRLLSRVVPRPGPDDPAFRETVSRLMGEIVTTVSRHAIWITEQGPGRPGVGGGVSAADLERMVATVSSDLSRARLDGTFPSEGAWDPDHLPVPKLASFIIRAIVDHHLHSFSPGVTGPPPATAHLAEVMVTPSTGGDGGRVSRSRAALVNSAPFLEEVLSGLLTKILYAFANNIFYTDGPHGPASKVTGIVKGLVGAIVREFDEAQIVFTEGPGGDLGSCPRAREMVGQVVNSVYDRILGEYRSLIFIYRDVQRDPKTVGRKIYNLVLGEIYDYQMEALISGESPANCASLRAEKIVANVLGAIGKGSPTPPSFVTVLPRSLIEEMIYKLLTHLFPSYFPAAAPETGAPAPADPGFSEAASRLTRDVLSEISEHEIRLAPAGPEPLHEPVERSREVADAVCRNILKHPDFPSEVERDLEKEAGRAVSGVVGLLMKELVNQHLDPFLERDGAPEAPPSEISRSETPRSPKGRRPPPPSSSSPPAVYSAAFLEDVIFGLVRKIYSLPDPGEPGSPEGDVLRKATKLVDSLMEEFKRNDIRVLPDAEEKLSCPRVDEETVGKIADSVYDQVLENYGSEQDIYRDLNEDDKALVETLVSLAKKATSAFRLRPLFSGGWSSFLLSFLEPGDITHGVKNPPPGATTTVLVEETPGPPPEDTPRKSQTPKPPSKVTPFASETPRPPKAVPFASRAPKTPKATQLASEMPRPPPKATQLTSETPRPPPKATQLVSEAPRPPPKAMQLASEAPRPPPKATQLASEAPRPPPKAMQLTSEAPRPPPKATQLVSEAPRPPPKATQLVSEAPRPPPKAAQLASKMPKPPKATPPASETPKPPPEATPRTSETPKPPSKVTSFASETPRPPPKATPLASEMPKPPIATRHAPKMPKLPPKATPPASGTPKPPPKITSFASETDSHLQVGSEGSHKGTAHPADLKVKKHSLDPDSHRVRYEERRAEPGWADVYEDLPASYEDVQNVIENIYSNILYSSDPQLSVSGAAKARSRSLDQFTNVIRRLVEMQNLPTASPRHSEDKGVPPAPSGKTPAPPPPPSPPPIFSAQFLEEVLTEIVNKLVSPSPPGGRDRGEAEAEAGEGNGELFEAAMRLVDSVAKELSEAQVRILRREGEAGGPASADRAAVDRAVHSSMCGVLRDYGPPEAIRAHLEEGDAELAKTLTGAVVTGLLEHRIDPAPSGEGPDPPCSTLEPEEVVRRVRQASGRSARGPRTPAPATVTLPHAFLEDLITVLLARIFSPPAAPPRASPGAGAPGGFSEQGFVQMKLVSMVMTEISKERSLRIQHAEFLGPGDDEVLRAVAESIYARLLPQFGSPAALRKCAAGGCSVLSETIADGVIREVSGEPLRTYFSGELTPGRCGEVDAVVDDILRGIGEAVGPPPPSPPARERSLPSDVLEEIAVKFLTKLLSGYPWGDSGEEDDGSPETEMAGIASKVVGSLQELLSRSQIRLVRLVSEACSSQAGAGELTDRIADAVYQGLLSQAGSLGAVFEDLLGEGDALADAIGSLMVREIENSEFRPGPTGEAAPGRGDGGLEAGGIVRRVLGTVGGPKAAPRADPPPIATLVEEVRALFLEKVAALPRAGPPYKGLSEPELHRAASRLKRSVEAEVSKSDVGPETAGLTEDVLNTEDVEMVSQVVDSIYCTVPREAGPDEDLLDELRGLGGDLLEKAAGPIGDEISAIPGPASARPSPGDALGNLDVEAAGEEGPEGSDGEAGEDLVTPPAGRGPPVKLVPCIGAKPVKIDPSIVSEHLAVISVKTRSLEELKKQCLSKTGLSLGELRKASITGKSCSSSGASIGDHKKERRISLDKTGRLDLKPLEAACRNSFQNITKPDITRVELLKDVQDRKDLIIRLVAHDIDQDSPGGRQEEDRLAEEAEEEEEEEIVLKEEAPAFFADTIFEEETESGESGAFPKPSGSRPSLPKPSLSSSSLKKFLSLSKCCQDASTTAPEVAVATPSQTRAPEEKPRHSSGTLPRRDAEGPAPPPTRRVSPEKHERPLTSGEKPPSSEPAHYLIHRTMSSSSYNQEDLASPPPGAPPGHIPEANAAASGDQKEAEASEANIEFFTIFEGHHNLEDSEEAGAGSVEGNASKHQINVLEKVSSALSRVFSRTSASPPGPP
ncbi:LOW QUALITY PROTEIN: fibrous sheath-interacting protein 2 [Tachyglossus aculeatus]|uniref:LOW QUALITY PROTEIN: fibrous sheath-interacting protein 2 n=1 Tax=Tachyglossus aculeatus TaxID=9261 RepID=UPI0018F2FFF2|nr:LOW QUALITY PROTEIN: fibrous sheath-interacting protein 2 [Tachyglossus aculeatus]